MPRLLRKNAGLPSELRRGGTGEEEDDDDVSVGLGCFQSGRT